MPRFLLCLTAALLLLVGCTSGSDEQPEDAPEPLRSLTPVERTVQTNPDRDEDRIRQALAVIDPCALFGTGRRADAVQALYPHYCSRNTGDRGTEIYFAALGEEARFNLQRRELAGVVSYREPFEGDSCRVYVPVSQELAIKVTDNPSTPCDRTVALAEDVVSVLLDRPQSAVRPVGIPRFTACDLLGPALEGTEVSDGDASLDRCSPTEDRRDLQLELAYIDPALAGQRHVRTISGTPVKVTRSEGQCWLDWTISDADQPVRAETRLAARLVAPSCSRGTALVTSMITWLDEAEPPRNGLPAGLLYRWSENDTSAVGACADILQPAGADLECTPAEPAEVPEDPRDLLEQGEADPNVLCAAVAPVVAEHFGDTLRPATARNPVAVSGNGAEPQTMCAFGEPTHALHLRIVVSTKSAPIPLDTEIASHPADVREEGIEPGIVQFRTFTVAWHGADDPGFLRVEIRVSPSRERQQGQPDQAPIEQSDAFMEDLVATLL